MCDLATEVKDLEERKRELSAKIKNQEKSLRQVCEAVSAMMIRLRKLEEGKLKYRGL